MMMKKFILFTMALAISNGVFAETTYSHFLLKKNTENPSWDWNTFRALQNVNWEMKSQSSIAGYKTKDVLILRGKLGKSKVIWAEGNKSYITTINFGSIIASQMQNNGFLWKKSDFFKPNELRELKAECTSKNIHIYKWQKGGYHTLYIKDDSNSDSNSQQTQDFTFSFDTKTICDE